MGTAKTAQASPALDTYLKEPMGKRLEIERDLRSPVRPHEYNLHPPSVGPYRGKTSDLLTDLTPESKKLVKEILSTLKEANRIVESMDEPVVTAMAKELIRNVAEALRLRDLKRAHQESSSLLVLVEQMSQP
jgi:hypothetical protein